MIMLDKVLVICVCFCYSEESKAVVSDDEDEAGVTGQVENQEVVPDISSDEEGVNK